MKLDIQLFATKTVNRKTNSSSTNAYQFKVTVTETGNISGNTREVHIVYEAKGTYPGGYSYMSNPYGYVYVNGEQKKSKQVRDIWPRDEWVEISDFKIYLEAGTTHTIRGRYNSNDTTSYMPLKGNVDCDVSITLEGTTATLNSVTLNSSFITNGKFTPNFTISSSGKYYCMTVLIQNSTPITGFGNQGIMNIQNGVEATLNSTHLKNIYDFIDANGNPQDLIFVLYTANDSACTDIIGSSNYRVTSGANMPTYNLQWQTQTIVDDNASVQYGGNPLSYYLNSGSYAKLLSKPKLTFSAVSSTGSTYGKTISYKIGNNSVSSPYSETTWNGNTYTVKASDGRVSEISWAPSMTVVNYFNPAINNVKVVRPIPTQGKIKISYNVSYFNGTGMKNLSNAEWNFYYREKQTDSWTKINELSGTGTSGSQSYTNVEKSGLDYKNAFYFKIELKDRIGNTATNVISYIPKGLPVWNAYTNSNNDNVLNVNGNLTVDGNITGNLIGNASTATNATNDQNGVNISNGYLRSYGQSNYNCNTCYNAGLYMVAGGSNCPSGSQYGSLLVLPYRKTKDNTSPDFAVQLFMPNGDDSSGIKSALYVRTSIANSWDSWSRLIKTDELFYSSGNTETYGSTDGRINYIANGYITSSTSALHMRIITPKRLDNISSITCTSCNVEARGDKGYLNSESGYHEFVGRSGYTIECYKQSNNSFNLYIKKSSAFTNVTNNTLISLSGQFTFRFN